MKMNPVQGAQFKKDEFVIMRNLETIKRELYERIRAQVADRLGLEDLEIKKSEKAFGRFFAKEWKKCSLSILQKQIEASDLVFWGDFHGVRQFQKNLLRWLKKQDLTQKPIVLVLECLPYESQKWVDQYLTGLITEEEFLHRVRWEKNWGFPWVHYKPLFDWAREKKQILKVVNGPKGRSNSKQRETFCLNRIQEIRDEFPMSRVFILYGEYHLLPQGFPQLLRKSRSKKLKSLFVFQNSDGLYFKKPPRTQKSEGEVFKLKNDYFCIQSVSPWVKWQNYNLYLEASLDSEFEEELDLTEHVLGVAQILSKTLNLPLDPNHYAVFTNQDRALWDHLRKIPDSELRLFESLIEEGLSFVYLPGGWAYLGKISANETASLAMQALFFQFNPRLRWKMNSESTWDFLIWILAFSYFGSKLINPHRKSPSLLELQKKARVLSGRPVERQAARLAVNYTLHQTLQKDSDQRNAMGFLSLSDQVRFQAVKWISSLMGEKIYNAYNQGSLNLNSLKAFMSKDPFDKNFQVVVHQLFETIDNI